MNGMHAHNSGPRLRQLCPRSSRQRTLGAAAGCIVGALVASAHAFLAERDENGAITLHYTLVREAKVPARPYLGFSSKTLDKVTRLLADRLAKAVAEKLGA